MNSLDSNEEALREALLNLQRMREKEKAAHEQTETLIKGLQILNESSGISDIFGDILGTLQRVIPFECAAILVETSDGYISTAVCSDNRLKYSRLPITGVFERALKGGASVLTNTARIKEWPQAEDSDEELLTSALLVGLDGLEQSTLIVCAGTDKYRLRKNDLELLKTFAPLATQAVKRAGELENLSILVSKLDYYAHYDMLTGLPNRTLFDKRLEQELNAPDNQFAVIFLDLDNFKQTNDTLGHSKGDILLSEVAFRISGVLDKKDTIARMGGDEFAFIIRKTNDVDYLSRLSADLIERISKPLYLSESCVEPSASLGVVTAGQLAESAQELMQNADIALYESKNNGRQCFSIFNREMKDLLNRRNGIESRLKAAVDNQEFRLAYQPIFRSDSLECFSVEVLVRWEIDGVPQYYPDEFIPIAEKSGSMCEIGRWIFSRALSDLSSWLKADNRRAVAINISDIQLNDPALHDQLHSIARSAGIDPVQIELELSERLVASDINETVTANLHELQNHGFAFAFDDFGTGQSSFLSLQNFPGTTLKIDKTFIDQLACSSKQVQLVEGIVNFAHSLDLLVVAEGVETEQQLKILQSMNCDLIQGYLLAKPMPLNSFKEGFEQPRCSATSDPKFKLAG